VARWKVTFEVEVEEPVISAAFFSALLKIDEFTTELARGNFNGEFPFKWSIKKMKERDDNEKYHRVCNSWEEKDQSSEDQ